MLQGNLAKIFPLAERMSSAPWFMYNPLEIIMREISANLISIVVFVISQDREVGCSIQSKRSDKVSDIGHLRFMF